MFRLAMTEKCQIMMFARGVSSRPFVALEIDGEMDDVLAVQPRPLSTCVEIKHARFAKTMTENRRVASDGVAQVRSLVVTEFEGSSYG